MINDENAGIFRPDRRATGVPLGEEIHHSVAVELQHGAHHSVLEAIGALWR